MAHPLSYDAVDTPIYVSQNPMLGMNIQTISCITASCCGISVGEYHEYGKGCSARTVFILISVTGNVHLKYKKIIIKSSCQSHLLRYMAAGHIFYKLKTWNAYEMQTCKMNGE